MLKCTAGLGYASDSSRLGIVKIFSRMRKNQSRRSRLGYSAAESFCWLLGVVPVEDYCSSFYRATQSARYLL